MWGQFGEGSADSRASLKSVCCQGCGEEIALVHPKEIAERIASGEYVTRRAIKEKQWGGGDHVTHVEGVFGMCAKCRREAQANIDLRGAEAATRAQAARIQNRIKYIRRNQPEMSIEEAAMRATEDEFEPRNEPNPAFRAYLLERYAPNKTERSLWQKVRDLLFGAAA